MGNRSSSDSQIKIEQSTNLVATGSPGTLLPPPSASSPSHSMPPKDLPPYHDADLISKIAETINAHKDFIEAGQALERALNKMITANNDDNIAEIFPLVDALRIHQNLNSCTSPSSSPSLIAVAIIFIFETEMSKPGAGANVSSAVYPTKFRRLFTKSLHEKWDVDDDCFTQDLVSSWNSILVLRVPAAKELMLLQTPVPDYILKNAATIMEEYASKVLPSCQTLQQWRKGEVKNLDDLTSCAINNCLWSELRELQKIINEKVQLESRNDKNLKSEIAQTNRRIDEIGRTPMPPEVLDSKMFAEIKTFGDWIEHRKIWIERPDNILKNRTLDFVDYFMTLRKHDLERIWIHRARNLITKDTIKSLRPGATPRFSHIPPYGLRCRDDEVEDLVHHLWYDRRGPSMSISSPCGLGKTAFLDSIGYSPKILRRFDENFTNIFILYVTFDEPWECEINTVGIDFAMKAAKYQMSLRLLAAACGIHRKCDLTGEVDRILRNLLAILNVPSRVLTEIIHPRICEVCGLPWEKLKLVVLMDHFSNLEPKNANFIATEKYRVALYKWWQRELVGPHDAIITSGCTPLPLFADTSGSVVSQFELNRFTSAYRRQESLPMRSEFFRLAASSRIGTITFDKPHLHDIADLIFSEPLAMYELSKTSSVIFGLLNMLRNNGKSCSADTIADEIPFLGKLAQNRSQHWQNIRAMMQWKSMQAAAGCLNISSEKFCALAKSPSVREVIRLPRYADSLYKISVNPLFLAKVVDSTSEFATFLRQLHQHSCRVARGLGRVESLKTVLTDRFGRRHDPNSSCETTECFVSPDDFTRFFFEDAVATGILFQTECRRLFLEENSSYLAVYVDLGEFLFGCGKVMSLAKNEISRRDADRLFLRLSLPEDNNDNETRATNCPGPSKINYYSDEGSFVPSLDTLHQRSRSDATSSNFGTIIFHVPCSSAGDRWMEIWIDINPSGSAPFEGKSLFPCKTKLQDALQQSKRLQSSDSNIDHVVHIVVTAFRAPKEIKQTPPNANLGRLSSYKLLFVHPDSTGFANLVSQPIKDSVPLFDGQLDESWATKVPPQISERKYYRATKRDITEHFSSVGEFTRWRNICFDEDCSIPLDNLNPELSELLTQKMPELRSVPLGCILEAVDVRPFSVDTLQKRYDDKFRVEKSNGQVQVFENDKKIFEKPWTDEIFQQILSQIKIGHLMHHEKDFWRSLFKQNEEAIKNTDNTPSHLSQIIWSVPVSDAQRFAPTIKTTFGNVAKILLDGALTKFWSGGLRR